MCSAAPPRPRARAPPHSVSRAASLL